MGRLNEVTMLAFLAALRIRMIKKMILLSLVAVAVTAQATVRVAGRLGVVLDQHSKKVPFDTTISTKNYNSVTTLYANAGCTLSAKVIGVSGITATVQLYMIDAHNNVVASPVVVCTLGEQTLFEVDTYEAGDIVEQVAIELTVSRC